MVAWNGDPERLKREVARRLLAAAVLLQAEHKRDLGRSNPAPHTSPAPRGEFPRGRTWNLRDGVAIDPPDLNRIAAEGRVRIGLLRGAFYGNVLAAKGWKGLLDTLDRVRGPLIGLLTGSV